MTLETRRFTQADYARLPEGFPVELIDGQLVKEPSPTYGHQRILGQIHVELYRFVGAGRVVVSPIDLFVDEYNVLQPDVLVIEKPLGPKAPRAKLPLLVVEVLSPSTAFRDRQQKRRIYLDAGVKEVWIVDPETETIEVHARGAVRRAGPDETVASDAVPGFSLVPREIFRA
ncbi:MAG: Uma2 family endonuclease [Planctomycetota bacterium]